MPNFRIDGTELFSVYLCVSFPEVGKKKKKNRIEGERAGVFFL